MKNGVYKFIEISGEFRFCQVQPFLDNNSHRSLLKDSEEASQLQSAGTIAVFDSFWKMYEWGSSSLCIQCNESIIPKLSEIIGKEFKNEY